MTIYLVIIITIEGIAVYCVCTYLHSMSYRTVSASVIPYWLLLLFTPIHPHSDI